MAHIFHSINYKDIRKYNIHIYIYIRTHKINIGTL